MSERKGGGGSARMTDSTHRCRGGASHRWRPSSAMPSRPACPPLVLSFGHLDPTGAGGLSADLMTLASLGAHPISVATALTVQDTGGVSAALGVDPEWI